MYRTAADREPAGRAPRELIYVASDDGAGRGDGMLTLFRHVSLPILAAWGVTWLAGSVAGTAAFAVGVAFSVWSWRTRKRRGAAVLAVDGGMLTVDVKGKRARSDRFRLGDLADVALDVKTIERVMEGGSAIPAVRFIDSKVGPKVDTARIVLVAESGREVPLTSDYLPHMHATEWLGKIRVFLRKHGWVPESEREGPPSDA